MKQDKGSYLFLFLIGVILRGVPELLVSGYPVGFETITYYAPPMMTFLGRGVFDVFVGFFRAGPLFYVLMWIVENVTRADVFLILKVVGPLLYGCLIVSFFVFLRRGLKLDWKLAFVAALLLVFQVAALRESWDRFRTVLGLSFLFVGLTALKSAYKYKWGLFSVLAVLTVLSREYVSLVLFVVVLGFVILEKKDRVISLISLVPAILIFAVAVLPRVLSGNFVPVYGFASGGYFGAVQDAFVIFVVCYLALLPFVVRGWRRDKLVWLMVGFLLLGSFSVLNPWFAVLGYQRWLMLLVFPFCVYAVWGFERFHLFVGRRIGFLAVIFLSFMIVGAGYSTGAFSYVGFIPNSYVAVNMVQSSISWNQVDDVKTVLEWLNRNVEFNSSVLAEERFYGWTLIYFERANKDVAVIPYGSGSLPKPKLESVLNEGFSRIYLIWYSGQSLNDFEVVYSRNSISIFQYVP